MAEWKLWENIGFVFGSLMYSQCLEHIVGAQKVFASGVNQWKHEQSSEAKIQTQICSTSKPVRLPLLHGLPQGLFS